MLIPAVASLPQNIQDTLLKVVKPKFDAHFEFTSGETARAIPAPNGEPWFIYPNQTMILDLVFLWSLFSDVYQTVGGPVSFADLVKADAELLSDLRDIVEGAPPADQAGAFWHFPSGQIPEGCVYPDSRSGSLILVDQSAKSIDADDCSVSSAPGGSRLRRPLE